MFADMDGTCFSASSSPAGIASGGVCTNQTNTTVDLPACKAGFAPVSHIVTQSCSDVPIVTYTCSGMIFSRYIFSVFTICNQSSFFIPFSTCNVLIAVSCPASSSGVNLATGCTCLPDCIGTINATKTGPTFYVGFCFCVAEFKTVGPFQWTAPVNGTLSIVVVAAGGAGGEIEHHYYFLVLSSFRFYSSFIRH